MTQTRPSREGRHRHRSNGLGAIAALAALLISGTAAGAADCRASPEPGLDLSACNRSNIMLPGANLEKANLTGADFSLSDLGGAVLAGANAEGAKLARTSLAGAIADGANFTQIEGYRTNFSGITAKGASFKGAELQRANFTNAIVTGASFEKAELGRADFTGASLGGNGFAFANLARASFKTAKIEGPLDFSRAYLFLTRFEGVDLTSAKGLTQPQIDLACGDPATKLPEGITAPATWPCPFD